MQAGSTPVNPASAGQGREDSSRPAVVITGASTGIGYATAQELIRHGYRVFGSVRKAEDASRLQAELGPAFHPLLMDVTDVETVRAAAAETERHLAGQGLAGLINNAGVAVAGPLMHLELDEVRYQFEVNVIGVLAVTQAFLPLLGARSDAPQPPGRIINISSVSGHTTYPFMAPYAASKHALESLSDGLRRELMLYGIDVIVMIIGSVRTPIWEKAEQQDLSRFAQTDYREAIVQMYELAIKTGREGLAVEPVARAIRQALESSKPKTRYVVANNYWLGWLAPRWLPDRSMDWAIARQVGLTRRPEPEPDEEMDEAAVDDGDDAGADEGHASRQ